MRNMAKLVIAAAMGLTLSCGVFAAQGAKTPAKPTPHAAVKKTAMHHRAKHHAKSKVKLARVAKGTKMAANDSKAPATPKRAPKPTAKAHRLSHLKTKTPDVKVENSVGSTSNSGASSSKRVGVKPGMQGSSGTTAKLHRKGTVQRK